MLVRTFALRLVAAATGIWTTGAAAGASVKAVPADFRVSITNASGKESYPISSFTYLLVPKAWKDGTKSKIMTDFLNWMLNQGQSMVEQLNYAPLPTAFDQQELAAVKQVH